MSDKTIPELSVVIPAYNEEKNVSEIYSRLYNVLEHLNVPAEIVFVDDGSTDNTWAEILTLNDKDERVKGVRFSRNFGHQYAVFAGLAKAKGNAVISMDADLQHPPDVIPKLVDRWKKGAKVVHTYRPEMKNVPLPKRIMTSLFYKFYNFLNGVNVGQGLADFRLIDRQVVDEILKLKEEGLFLRGLVQWVGFKQDKVPYECQTRLHGKPKYNFFRLAKLAYSGITSFSLVPLRLGIFIGVLTSFIAFCEIIYALYVRFFTKHIVPGWTSMVSILSFLFGILFILIGILGEYIGRILVEVRERPRYIVSEEI